MEDPKTIRSLDQGRFVQKQPDPGKLQKADYRHKSIARSELYDGSTETNPASAEHLTLTLSNGVEIPVIGLGTWELSGQKCTEVIDMALGLGYRHIDTAIMYENQEEIGRAIKRIDREKLFLTSKVPHTELRKADFLKAAQRILEKLDTDYVDLLLIHWPNERIDMEQPLEALQELLAEKKIRAAGVSNFTSFHLEEALRFNSELVLNNQVECHPLFPQFELVNYCKRHNISLTAYSPLARGDVQKDSVLTEIAEKYATDSASVSLRWLIQRGLVVIPKASSEEHLKANLEVLSWELEDEDMKRIDSIGKRERKVNPEWAEFVSIEAPTN